METQNSALQIPTNCCAVETASHASILIDGANFFNALYEALQAARHSIFVLGWDIDSRIRLLRDRENQESGVTFFDLIGEKARANPDLQIFLVHGPGPRNVFCL
jgi:phosphatidylserine/phosphatidylglycerophosphate/cardiolipin synthase-like enzyme